MVSSSCTRIGVCRKNQQYHCDYCKKDLRASLRIKCDECPDFDLCLECFSVGAEIAPHTNTHAYRVVDNLSFPVYTLDWGADEETLLLEGVEHFGLGNWTQIGHHVGKSPEDCKEHYFKVYVETESFPQPQRSYELKSVDIRKLIDERRRAGARRIAVAHQEASGGGAKTPRLQTPSLPVKSDDESMVKVESSLQIAKSEMTEETPLVSMVKEEGVHATTGGKTKAGGPNIISPDGSAPVAVAESQQSGYNVKRNEFEIEYDHQAEHLIAELDFAEGDSDQVVAEKLKLIDIYNRRLDERAKRKEFVLSRGLVKVRRQTLIDRRRSTAERDMLGRFRVFARYMPHPQWESLADNLAVEARLRARIDELKQYRAMGMRTFEEVDTHLEKNGAPKREPSINNQPGRSKLQRILVDNCALEEELGKSGNKFASIGVHKQHVMIPEGRDLNGLQVWRAKRGILLDVSSIPDVGPLNQSERKLCAAERYLPAQYLTIKAEIMKKQERNGYVVKNDILSLPFAVDQERSLRLLDFFKQNGWVKVGRAQKAAK